MTTPCNQPAALLAAGLYAGKIIFDIVKIPLFFGFGWSDNSGRFAGGLSDPGRVEISHDGRLSLVREFSKRTGKFDRCSDWNDFRPGLANA